jgi:hypothetical protein
MPTWPSRGATRSSPADHRRQPAEQLDAAVRAVESPLEPDLKARLDELTTEYRFGDAAR